MLLIQTFAQVFPAGRVMFRNQYDTDCITWSPAGRIHQIEYAMEAVKQGSAAIGLRSNKHAIVATLKRSPGELSSYQKKIFVIDDNMGIAIAGATHLPPPCHPLPSSAVGSRPRLGRCVVRTRAHGAAPPLPKRARRLASSNRTTRGGCRASRGCACARQVHAHRVHQPPLRVRGADAGQPAGGAGRGQGADRHAARWQQAVRCWAARRRC